MKVVEKCFKSTHRPINPHSQRLLAAEAREAAKPKGGEKPQAKGKAKAKAQTSKGKEDENPVPRTKYAAAKKEFMEQEWFLDWTYNLPVFMFLFVIYEMSQ